jgi:hypothetical protein
MTTMKKLNMQIKLLFLPVKNLDIMWVNLIFILKNYVNVSFLGR